MNKRDSLLGDAHNTWSLVLEYLQARVDGEVIETWFSPIVFEGFDGDKAKVVVPNKFFGEWLERNYLDVLGEAFQAAGSLSGPVEVEFIVRDSDEQALPTQGFPQSVIAPNQKPSISRNKKNPLPNPKYTFDKFWADVGQNMNLYNPGWGDSMHCVIMKNNDVENILSLDAKDDFELVPGINLFHPEDMLESVE